jgi:hypothetical protein
LQAATEALQRNAEAEAQREADSVDALRDSARKACVALGLPDVLVATADKATLEATVASLTQRARATGNPTRQSESEDPAESVPTFDPEAEKEKGREIARNANAHGGNYNKAQAMLGKEKGA